MEKVPTSFSPSRIDIIQRYLSIENMVILDAGCGTGEYDNLFYRKKTKKVIGCDINKKSVKYACSKNKNIVYSISDVRFLPFKNSVADLIFINEVLEHVTNEDRVILEVYRVLKENGFIIIFAPNKFYPWETHFMIGQKNLRFPFLSWAPTKIRKIIFRVFNSNYIQIYTSKALKEKLNKYFQIIDSFEIFPELRFLHHKEYHKKILNIMKLLSRTPIRKLGVSIFIIAQKRTILEGDEFARALNRM